MQIPMIFFTIIIERRKVSQKEAYAAYLQEQAIKQLEERRIEEQMKYPEYCYRI